MKFVSWNVNGLRACIQKDFLTQFQKMDADFFCLQETKLSAGQLQLDLPGYEQYWCYAEKKGYSGTAIFTKHHPLSVTYGIGVDELDNEGRVITLEYKEFYLLTCYTPNAQRGLARIDHRMTWDEAFRSYISRLDKEKPVVICGDLNVAHKEIDLKNPASNRGNAGFSDEERESFQKTLDLGFTDTFRHLYPDVTGRYSWWSYMFHARENNAGWRIDYFLVSDRIRNQIQQADIYSDILGSDHCPVMLELDTLVNGAIWSPNAGVPSVIETEPPKKKAKSASPVNGKAAALLCVVLALILSVILIPFGNGHGSTSPTRPTMPETTDNVLFNVQVAKNFSLVKNKPNNELVYSNKLLMFDGQMYYVDTYSTGKLSPSNIYLIITLTDLGKYYQAQGMKPTIKEVNFNTSIVQSTPSLGNINMTAYYSDETRTEMMGWLVWGNLTKNSTVDISNSANDYHIYLYLTPYSTEISDEVPVYTDIMSVFQINDPPMIMGDENVEYYVFLGDTMGVNVSNSIQQIEYTVLNANFWFILSLTRDGMEILGDEDPYLSYGYIRDNSDDNYIDTIPYYSTDGKIAGWIFYGRNISSIRSITASTSQATLSFEDSFDIITFIQKDQAYQMTTKELVQYIINNPNINAWFESHTFEEDFATQFFYDNLREKYPAIAVMNSRNDAGEYLDIYENQFAEFLLNCWIEYYEPPSQNELDEMNGQLANVIVYDSSLHLTTSHIGDLWVSTITASDGTYYTYPTGFFPEDSFFLIRVELKDSCIGKFASDSDLSYSYGGEIGSTPFKEIVYYTDETLQEVAGWFIYCTSSITHIRSIKADQVMIYNDTVNVSSVLSTQVAKNMTTQALIEYVRTNDRLLYSIPNPEPGHEDWLADLAQIYPVLNELFARADAGSYLQQWFNDTPNSVALTLYERWTTFWYEDDLQGAMEG